MYIKNYNKKKYDDLNNYDDYVYGMSQHNYTLNAKVKKFCISLLESAGSFAYTRGVMGELDTSIRSWLLSSFFHL